MPNKKLSHLDGKRIVDTYQKGRKLVKFHSFLECLGVSLTPTSHGRLKIPPSAIHVVSNLRSSNISICAAINVNWMLFNKCHDQAFNRDLFDNYIDVLPETITTLNIEQATIFMNNRGRAHNTLFNSIFALRESYQEYVFEVEGRNTKYEI
ncbi:hypothetical protein RF11_02355 [Thelohanellus kitauei]|uniref:Uncharacterized protein n=1 Tax=Thelohanellus kitauei TaxID=669202 RepID=A0A0C2NH74_THEKT|nr:hypothetical protein RF11_02355 [Thelohanellus kitauei]